MTICLLPNTIHNQSCSIQIIQIKFTYNSKKKLLDSDSPPSKSHRTTEDEPTSEHGDGMARLNAMRAEAGIAPMVSPSNFNNNTQGQHGVQGLGYGEHVPRKGRGKGQKKARSVLELIAAGNAVEVLYQIVQKHTGWSNPKFDFDDQSRGKGRDNRSPWGCDLVLQHPKYGEFHGIGNKGSKKLSKV